ncbi:MAG: hypothetical protein AAGF11_02920 [Myxococcota bacterium]
MASLPGSKPRWHLIEKPRAPFRCDVCGQLIPESELHTFTTLPKMYYETPPAGYEPCYKSFDAMKVQYERAVDRGD